MWEQIANQRMRQDIATIADNTSQDDGIASMVQAMAMQAQADALNNLAESQVRAEVIRHVNQVNEIAEQLDADITLLTEQSRAADQEIRDVLGTKDATGGYLNQLIEIADGAGASFTTSTGASLTIGPKRD